jgi:methylated-DNA-protein-cysteine methyltransferase related protein
VRDRRPRSSARRTLDPFRKVIARIPRGKVATYGMVAAAAGHPLAARMTVWALQRSEGLPWHRVVAAGGRIALSGEEGAEQRLRLEVEGVTFRGARVRMDRHLWRPGSRTPRSGRRPRKSAI